MATRKTPEGNFYRLQQEAAQRRKEPYVLTEDITINVITRKQAKEMQKAGNNPEMQLRILLGEHFDAVDALYDDRPIDEWVAFQRDLLQHYYGTGAVDVPGGSQGS